MDLNSGFGLQKISGSDQWMHVHDDRFGNLEVPVKQRYAAYVMLRLIQDLDLVLVNLHIGEGPTTMVPRDRSISWTTSSSLNVRSS
eukprot:6621481-Pyramimonas_sp.AAC.1